MEFNSSKAFLMYDEDQVVVVIDPEIVQGIFRFYDGERPRAFAIEKTLRDTPNEVVYQHHPTGRELRIVPLTEKLYQEVLRPELPQFEETRIRDKYLELVAPYLFDPEEEEE